MPAAASAVRRSPFVRLITRVVRRGLEVASLRGATGVTRRAMESSARLGPGQAFLLSGLARTPPDDGRSRGRRPLAASRLLFDPGAGGGDDIVVALVPQVVRLPDIAEQELRLVVGSERWREPQRP